VFISFIVRGRVFFQSALISFQDFDSHRRAKTQTVEQQGHIRSELMHTSVTEETIECCNSSLDHKSACNDIVKRGPVAYSNSYYISKVKDLVLLYVIHFENTSNLSCYATWPFNWRIQESHSAFI
jgi:hypothetical protein